MRNRYKKAPSLASRRKDPTKVDPTRTGQMQKRFSAALTKKFAALRMDVMDLIQFKDIMGLKQTPNPLLNAFCPTGPGGGQDPHCSPSGGKKGGSKLSPSEKHPQVVEGMSSFTPTMQRTIKTNLKRVKEHDSPEALTAHLKEEGHNVDAVHRRASYDRSTGTLHLTPDASPSVVAHEMGHALDGQMESISRSPEFQRAFKKDAKRLSDYATTHPAEALAELMRVRHDEGEKAAAKKAPGMVKALKAYGYPWHESPTTNRFNPGQPRDSEGRFSRVAGLISSSVTALGTKTRVLEHMVKDKIAEKIAKLPHSIQTSLSFTMAATFASWTAGHNLVERVAKERGFTDEQAKKLRGTLATVDFASFKPLSMIAAGTGVSAAAIGVASFVPPATAAYLAYSTARHPIATYRAARGMVKDALGHASRIGGHVARGLERGIEGAARLTGNAAEDIVALIADALDKHDFDDWYIALLHASMQDSQTIHDAIALANRLYEDQPFDPSDPADDDEAWLTAIVAPTQNYDPTPYTINTDWKFKADPEKLRAFQDWLAKQITLRITNDQEEQLWLEYARQGYLKGAGRAFDDTVKNPIIIDPAEQASVSDFYLGTKDEFLRSAFAHSVSVDKIRLLAGRSFDDLEGITSDMGLRMSRVLTDGLVQGKSPRDVARDLARQVDIGRDRALLIARTEIIRAHAEGQLDALDSLGVEEVGAAVEWSTTGDWKVCPKCAALNGVVLKIGEARGMLPRHPNCRCAWIPAGVGEKDGNQKATYSQIRAALKKSGTKSGAPLSKTRPAGVRNMEYLVNEPLQRFSDWLLNCRGKGGKPGPCPLPSKGQTSSTPPPNHQTKKVKMGEHIVTAHIGPDGMGKVVDGPEHLKGKTIKMKAPEAAPTAPPPSPPPPPAAPAPKPPETQKPTQSTGAKFKDADGAETHFSKAYKTNLSKGKMSDADFVKHAHAIAGEYDRLGSFSGVAKALKKRASKGQDLVLGHDFNTEVGSAKGGTASYKFGEGIKMSKLDHDTAPQPIFGHHTVGDGLESSFRHELGHELLQSAFSSSQKKQWMKAASKYVGTSTVSRYGGTNESELFSESFAAYTHNGYKRGMLPTDLEKFMDKHIKGEK